MASVEKTGNSTFDSAAATAELVRQNATLDMTQVATKNAEIVYYRTLVTAALKNNVSPAPFMTALKEIAGVGQ
jgi:hypothetical protein